ncbi:MAG: Rieske 2Fe-2S domain-containing protein [Rubrobacteraceae bacterium]|nr:Rieske 2Fe-2S domain-containing protein [Rubrobacteraceae bacterium]
MAQTLMQRVVEALPFLDEISDAVQPEVQKAVDAGGTTARNVLDGVWLEAPLHPALTDVPIGAWTAALVFDGLDLATGKRSVRHAADASLVFGTLGALGAAVTGLSDWRYLSGGSRRMGAAHALLNSIGLILSVVSLVQRATGRRNAGRLVFLTGYSISGMSAHLGGELSYHYGLRVDRNVFEEPGPDEFVAVLDEAELPAEGMRRVEVEGVGVLLSRSSAGEVCAIAATCNHFSGALEQGDRQGDTVVCPWHHSRFDLCSGEVIDGPAVFPQSRYETRLREGKIEVKAAEENVQKNVR